jgi:hypothetical protein
MMIRRKEYVVGVACSTHREKRNIYKILLEKIEEKR